MKRKRGHAGGRKSLNLALLGAGLAAGAYAAWKLTRRIRQEERSRKLPRGQKILIIGAGFAGTSVARELASFTPRPEQGQITLVDEDDFMLFTPMLTEAAGGELDPRHIISPLRDLPSGITFVQGRVVAIDLNRKQVTLKIGENGSGVPPATRTLAADHLVIALGSVPNFHNIPGIKEHSLTMKSLSDAVAIRNHALEMMERAETEREADSQRAFLTFVVGGGGYTGVETIAAVNDLVRDAAKNHTRARAQDIRTIIVEPGDRLLPELNAGLAAYARKKLEERGVEARLKTKITGAGAGYVELEGGGRIPTQTFIWAGGVTPSPVIGSLDCKRGHHGGIVVDEHCAVPDHAGVWALGDCAEVPKSHSKKTYAPTAQNATREGALVARNILASLRGEEPRAFSYRPIGELALVGKHSGVARIYGLHFSGLTAWAMWRAIYWAKMPNRAQRVRILLDWLLDFTFGRPIAALPAAPPHLSSPAISDKNPG